MNQEQTVLIVDDEREECQTISDTLRRAGYRVECAEDPAHVEAYMSEHPAHVLVSKLKLDGNGNGIHFVRTWKKQHPEAPIIAITSRDGVDEAVTAMRLGVIDCLTQPIDVSRLTKCVEEGLARTGSATGKAESTDAGPTSPSAVSEKSAYKSAPRYDSPHNGHGNGKRQGEAASEMPSRSAAREQRPEFGRMVGQCPSMQKVFEQAECVANTESTVLITGGTGTGKELLADAIHQLSGRNKMPFVAVNVAAVPNSLIESELFGHVKGAFTDAATDRVGRFEAASGGTLFIDEIGDLRLQSQAKLLRVLETHVINRVGSNRDVPVDVRVIAATSRNLSDMLRRGQFREDLYYRLNVVQIQLPSLADRKDDIPLLVRHFLDELAASHGRPSFEVDDALSAFLREYEWPGNVRQLKNCLESMIVMAAGNRLTIDDLPPTVQQPVEAERLATLPLGGCPLAELEKEAICQTLEQFDGNRTRAARSLGVSVRTLQRKLKQWKESGADVAVMN